MQANIKMNSYSFLVEIKWSKTIQCSQKLLLIPLLAMPDSSLCPVAAFSNIVKLVPETPFSDFSSHSIRRGGTKNACQA